jgi:hypothetical protein
LFELCCGCLVRFDSRPLFLAIFNKVISFARGVEKAEESGCFPASRRKTGIFLPPHGWSPGNTGKAFPGQEQPGWEISELLSSFTFPLQAFYKNLEHTG